MTESAERLRIGCCISAHGFGHATRAMAVMHALGRRLPVRYEIVTTAPAWLFDETLTTSPFRIHPLAVDVGLVQKNAMEEDLDATIRALDGFYPLAAEKIDQVAALLAGCCLVLCDIAPLGIAAARRAGVPSVLLENFTWDWIYQGYAEQWPGLAPHIEYLAGLFAQADYHIQAAPVCRPVEGALVVPPIARPTRAPGLVRDRLRPVPGQRLIMVSMGGVGGCEIPIAPLLKRKDLLFLLTGRSRENEFVHNLRFLGQEDVSWYHPDLVAAADLVVGKLGYSTVAEAYQAGASFAYIRREGFRESEPLAAFVDDRMDSWEISFEQLRSGTWLKSLPQIPGRPFTPTKRASGANQAADYLASLLTAPAHARP